MGENFNYQMIDLPSRQRFVFNNAALARLSSAEGALEGVNALLKSGNPYGRGSERTEEVEKNK
jgi:hypothetical protein